MRHINKFEKVLETIAMARRLRDAKAWEQFRLSRLEQKFAGFIRKQESKLAQPRGPRPSFA